MTTRSIGHSVQRREDPRLVTGNGRYLDDLGRDEPALLHELLRRLQTALETAEAWGAELTAGPARRRMLKLLQQLDRLGDGDGRIWLPRRADIGAMLDITLETSSRLISQFGREGVLVRLPPSGARLDRDALTRALAEVDT